MSIPDETQTETKRPEPQLRASFAHSLPALTILILLIGAAILADRLATSNENRIVHGLAPLLLAQDEVGTVAQQAAFRQPNLLPVIGSSEMVITNTPYRAFNFFNTYPTGFNVFDIARPGDSSINMAQDVASLGPVLKGKKVVISFAPGMFAQPETKQDAYASNFSILHASGLIFSPYLSLKVKKMAAARMAEYPETLV